MAMAGITCWVGMLNFDLCCRGPWGEGLATCWEGPFTWDQCCKTELERKNITRDMFESHMFELDGQRVPPGAETAGLPRGVNGMEAFTDPNAPKWLQEMATCLTQYDDKDSRRWFLAHSGVPAHFVAHVGNPGACIDGGHKFYWGLLVVGINLAGNPYQPPTMSDVALEFSICVPKVCQYAVVDAVLVPFYLGPYLGKPWGPSPEYLYRFNHLGDGTSVPGNQKMQASSAAWMSDILLRGQSSMRDFYEREWPFRRELFEYETTWWPSPTNAAVLAFLLLPPFLAGFCVWFCLNCLGLELTSAGLLPIKGGEPGYQEAADAAATSDRASTNAEKAPFAAAAPDDRVTEAGSVAAAVSLVIKGFAPQTYIKELTAPSKNDLVGMHQLRILLQLLVTWQHTVLFVEWLGNAGHHGIVSFLPLTNDVARIMGRVNTTFACLTVHLSLQSVVRTLQSADKRAAGGRTGASTSAHPAQASPSASATNGHRHQGTSSSLGAAGLSSAAASRQQRRGAAPQPPREVSSDGQEPLKLEMAEPSTVVTATSIPRAGVVLWLWCIRRWLRQVGELGLWTWYFTDLTQDIPWKPFPDFVQVWYRDRSKSCRRALAPHQFQLPMWLLSLLFVYEPVNSVLRLHRPPVSLCHNMQVFENLFTLSVCGAILGVVKHLFGRRALLALAAFLSAVCVRWEPPWKTDTGGGDEEEIGWDMVIFSTMEMLPAAVTTALLLSEVWPESVWGTRGSNRRTQPWKYLVVLGAGLALDFIRMGHSALLADYIPIDVGRKLLLFVLGYVQKVMETLPTAVFFLREGLHALGVALLLRSFKPEASGDTNFPGWARCISRLSLSVNLTNIFAIHYVRGRMLDHPVEFSHVHVLVYTIFAWVAAVIASLVAHCMVSPYVTAAEAALNKLGRALLSPRVSQAKKVA